MLMVRVWHVDPGSAITTASGRASPQDPGLLEPCGSSRNAGETVYPGTDLVLRYAVKDVG